MAKTNEMSEEDLRDLAHITLEDLIRTGQRDEDDFSKVKIPAYEETLNEGWDPAQDGEYDGVGARVVYFTETDDGVEVDIIMTEREAKRHEQREQKTKEGYFPEDFVPGSGLSRRR